MKPILSALLLAVGLFLAPPALWANTVADATRISLMEARENLIALLAAPDKESQHKRMEAIKRATAKVDVLIEKNSDTLKTFQTLWTAFKATRDGEIIPRALDGRKEEAMQLATGLQAERFQQMLAILAALPQ